jgi:hypothetical protein
MTMNMSNPIKSWPLLKIRQTHEDILYLQNLIDTLKIDYKSFIFPLEQLPTMNLGELETDFALFENAYVQYQLNKNLQPFSNEANANTYTIRELTKSIEQFGKSKNDT